MMPKMIICHCVVYSFTLSFSLSLRMRWMCVCESHSFDFDCIICTRQICTRYYCIPLCINYIENPISKLKKWLPANVVIVQMEHAVGNKFSLDLENLQVKFNQKTTNANEIYKNFHCHKLVTASICILQFITFIYIYRRTHKHVYIEQETDW